MKDSDVKVVGLSSNKSKGKANWKVMGAIVGIVVLVVGIVAGIILVRQNQNIEKKAACVAACPDSNGDLLNCYNTDDTDGEVSKCAWAGRVEVCGQNVSDAKQFCCPAPGGKWTTNLNACKVATPTATAKATATATATTKATATATAKATATATGSLKACGGTCTGNANCSSGLFCYIVSGQSSGYCRNSSCATDTDCVCGGATATATSTALSTPTSTSDPDASPTALPIPVTGAELPTILGAGFGIIMILVSMALAL